MRALIYETIVNSNGPFMFMVVAFFACVLGVSFGVTMRRARRYEHEEAMAKIAKSHAENMLKIERENPKLVGQSGKEAVIEHRRD